VAPTHREGDKVTREIREGLQASGRLGRDEQRLPILVSANLTEAERRDPNNYLASDVLLFHQNAKGFRKGQRMLFNEEQFPASEAARFQVYRSRTLSVAEGETLRITKNGKSLDGTAICITTSLLGWQQHDEWSGKAPAMARYFELESV
jgi:hypothetical protein